MLVLRCTGRVETSFTCYVPHVVLPKRRCCECCVRSTVPIHALTLQLDHNVCSTQPPFSRRTQDTQSEDRNTAEGSAVCALHVCVLCARMFPKVEDEINLKKQSPAAPEPRAACFLGSSGAWLPQQARSLSAAPWHSASHDQRHLAQSTPTDGYARGRPWPWRRLALQLHARCRSATVSLTEHPAPIEASKPRRLVRGIQRWLLKV